MRDSDTLKIMFYDYLPDNIKFFKFASKSLLDIRNICMILAGIEILSALVGMALFFIRRVNLILKLNIKSSH